jgi:integrase
VVNVTTRLFVWLGGSQTKPAAAAGGQRRSALGKGGHIRTVPMLTWVKTAVDAWTAAGIWDGTVFFCHQQGRSRLGQGMSAKVLWDVVCTAAARAGIEKLAPHDLRRSCARLRHLAGGELDQIPYVSSSARHAAGVTWVGNCADARSDTLPAWQSPSCDTAHGGPREPSLSSRRISPM